MIRSDSKAKAASSPVCTVNGDPHSSSRVSFDGTSAAWVMIAASATERTMRKADEIPMLSFPFLERSRIRITVRVHMSTYTGMEGRSRARASAPPSSRPCMRVYLSCRRFMRSTMTPARGNAAPAKMRLMNALKIGGSRRRLNKNTSFQAPARPWQQVGEDLVMIDYQHGGHLGD